MEGLRPQEEEKSHRLVKLGAPRAHSGPLDVWVKRKSKRHQLYEYCNGVLLQRGVVRVHALGAAIEKAVCLATELERRWVRSRGGEGRGALLLVDAVPFSLARWIGDFMFDFLCRFSG